MGNDWRPDNLDDVTDKGNKRKRRTRMSYAQMLDTGNYEGLLGKQGARKLKEEQEAAYQDVHVRGLHDDKERGDGQYKVTTSIKHLKRHHACSIPLLATTPKNGRV